MYICSNCFSIIRDKLCIDCGYKKKFYCDDDFADIISTINKIFIKLNWNLRTSFCCAGHTDASDEYSLPQSYILFSGDIKKLKLPPITKIKKKINSKEIIIKTYIYNDNLYIGISMNENDLTIKQKKSFLYAKYVFHTYLWDFVENLYEKYR